MNCDPRGMLREFDASGKLTRMQDLVSNRWTTAATGLRKLRTGDALVGLDVIQERATEC